MAQIINKSTVPVGTAEKVRAAVDAELAARGVQIEYDVASNPEFLKEGMAIEDFMQPDRIIVGVDSQRARQLLDDLYEPFVKEGARLIHMGVRDDRNVADRLGCRCVGVRHAQSRIESKRATGVAFRKVLAARISRPCRGDPADSACCSVSHDQSGTMTRKRTRDSLERMLCERSTGVPWRLMPSSRLCPHVQSRSGRAQR